MVDNSPAFGRNPRTVESEIIADFELIAYRKGLHIRREEADLIRGFVSRIVEDVLGQGGAGRVEDDRRRYTARERDDNLIHARQLARKVAQRATLRAREGNAEVISEELWIGQQRMRYRTTSRLFASLCPPPLPPICFNK